jgi:adenylate cyclase
LRLGSLRARVLSAVALAVVGGLASFGGLHGGVFNGYRQQVTDSLQPTGTADPRVLVVGIDGRSLAEVGVRWPWPRSVHAQIIRNLAGAKAVVYDVLFSPGSPDDNALAAAIRRSGNVVLSAEAVLDAKRGASIYTATEVTPPAPKLAATAVSGHANVLPDPVDGVVRSVPLLVETKTGDLLPSMSLAALARVDGLQGPYTFGPRGIEIGDRIIPTGRRGLMTIAYAPELRPEVAHAPIVSAVDVLKGRVPRSAIVGKIVLIGATDASLGDNRPTPGALEMPGVLVHANALDTMLTGHFLRPTSDVRTAAYAGLLALLIALVTLIAPVSIAPIATVVALAGYVVWAIVRFDSGSILDLIYPPLTVVLAFVGALGIRYFTEMRGRRRVSMLFSQYVPKGVANELLASGRVNEAVQGERLMVTALFCDLRAFTAMSSKMEPTKLRDLLNIYYDETSRLVYDSGGTLLTYIGDEVFAVWGAPLPDPDSASRAVACARAIQDANERLNRRLADEELPSSVTYGIGLHTGEVIAAHVGTDVHRQYTILGDTVNCAARLCTIAGRNEIVVSAETYGALDASNGRPPAELLPGIRLKGVGRDLLPHRLWPDELRDPTGEQRQGKVE